MSERPLPRPSPSEPIEQKIAALVESAIAAGSVVESRRFGDMNPRVIAALAAVVGAARAHEHPKMDFEECDICRAIADLDRLGEKKREFCDAPLHTEVGTFLCDKEPSHAGNHRMSTRSAQ